MMINANSSRDEIISAAEEILDQRDQEIRDLRDDRKACLFLLLAVITWATIF